jgi:vacuolar protein sorting-associated protein 13A/C
MVTAPCNTGIPFFQVHLRRVMHRDRFMRKSSIVHAIGNRIWRDLIHNPLHLIFSIDVLGMTSSTLASLSKGFAELSTDGQFLQLRSKQVIPFLFLKQQTY